MKNIFHIVAFLCIALFAGSCGRQVMDCHYTVRTMAEVVKGQKIYDYTDKVRIFAYSLDTLDWEVASYEDALEGIVTSRVTGATATPDFEVSATSTGVYEFDFTEAPIMLVVCHTEHPAYGWRDSGIVNNLPEMNVPFIFHLWKYVDPPVEEGATPPPSNIITEDELLPDDGGWRMVYLAKQEAGKEFMD